MVEVANESAPRDRLPRFGKAPANVLPPSSGKLDHSFNREPRIYFFGGNSGGHFHQMIIRIFQVEIDPNKRQAFEDGFFSISVNAVKHTTGLVSCEIGRPTIWAPNSYVMITKWNDDASLVAFAGEKWNVPVIPDGMEGFAVNASVSHYIQMEEEPV